MSTTRLSLSFDPTSCEGTDSCRPAKIREQNATRPRCVLLPGSLPPGRAGRLAMGTCMHDPSSRCSRRWFDFALGSVDGCDMSSVSPWGSVSHPIAVDVEIAEGRFSSGHD